MTTNGKAIAMTVAGLLLAAVPTLAHADDKTKEAKVKCAGVNECKGKGWTETTAKECKDKKGTVVADKGAKDAKPAPATPKK